MKEKRNLILTLAGIGVSGLGTELYVFAISYYILAITGSSTSFAMSLVFSVLPRVIFNPIAGNITDRVNRKALVVGADLASGILMLGLYFLTVNQELSLPMIYSASFLLSTLYVFLSNAFSASNASIVTMKYLTKLNSYQQSIMAVIQIGAPALAGAVFGIVGIRLFILINGMSFIVSALTETQIDFKFNSIMKEKEPEAAKTSFVQNFLEGFRYVRSKKMFVSLAVYALLVNFFLSSMSVIVPYTLVTIHGFGSDLAGYVQAAFPLGMLIVSVIVGSIGLKFSGKLFAGSMQMFVVLLILLSLPTLPFIEMGSFTPFYYGIIFAMTAGNATVVNVPLSVKLQSSIDEAYRGRFFGFLGMMSSGIVPVAFILTGLLINIVPTYVILYVSCAAVTIISISVARNKSLDEEVKPQGELVQTVL